MFFKHITLSVVALLGCEAGRTLKQRPVESSKDSAAPDAHLMSEGGANEAGKHDANTSPTGRPDTSCADPSCLRDADSRDSSPLRDASYSDASLTLDASSSDASLQSGGDAQSDASVCDSSALALYKQKIEPLFSEEHPSTCGQCHLPGVDLSLFVRATPCETFSCLTERGLIDEQDPTRSTILDWIGRATPDSLLITQKVIAEEHDAFEQWISYSLACGACQDVACPATSQAVCGEVDDPVTDGGVQGPVVDDPAANDPGGCSEPALESLFRNTVYTDRWRCSPCHFNDHEDPDTPLWIEVSFDCQEASVRTQHTVLGQGYVNPTEPDQSLLLLKPLAESAGGVPHGGGDKFYDTSDVSYIKFKYFIDRWVGCQQLTDAQ